MKKSRLKTPFTICIILVLVCMGVFTARLVDWQLIHGRQYQMISAKSTNFSVETDAVRGEILDSGGKGLVVNVTHYKIVIDRLYAVWDRKPAHTQANREAVRLSGVDTRRWEMLAYVICGALAGFAAIFFVGCYTTVQPVKGDTFNNEAIAACVMGGTSMAGGLASILGTVIGAFIIAIMQEGILSMGFNIAFQYSLTALILLGAVIADVTSRRRKN